MVVTVVTVVVTGEDAVAVAVVVEHGQIDATLG